MPRKPIEEIFCPVGWGFWQCLTAYICHMGRGIFAVLTSVNVNSPICPGGRWGLCASQFQPRASPAPPPWANSRAFEKFFSDARPCGQFLLANAPPPPRSFFGGQMPGPPVHPVNIQNYYLPYLNKHNCFSSIELHKTGHKMSHSPD